MIPQEQLNEFIKIIMSQFACDDNCKTENKATKNVKKKLLCLTPAEIMLVAGILTDALSIESLSVNRDQQIQIVVGGSLKRKTELEKTLDEIGQKPFDEVLKALLTRM